MPPSPTVLLYDWDNTLVDGWAAITAALNAAFAEFAMPPWTEADTKRRVRVALRESFPLMFGDRLGTCARRVLRRLRRPPPRPRPPDARRGRGACCRRRLAAGRGLQQGRPLSCAPRSRISAGRRISAPWSAPATPRPTSRTRRRSTSRWTQIGQTASASVWYLGDTALDMQAARAAGVTAVLIGDAAHDGGVDTGGPASPFHLRARSGRTAACACLRRRRC